MEAQGLVDILTELFNYTRAALVSSTDACAQLLPSPDPETCMCACWRACSPVTLALTMYM
eukprot:206448-Prymnesium_polylepis.1